MVRRTGSESSVGRRPEANIVAAKFSDSLPVEPISSSDGVAQIIEHEQNGVCLQLEGAADLSSSGADQSSTNSGFCGTR